MATLKCWALKINGRAGYVKLPPGTLRDLPFRTMLFRTRQAANNWVLGDPYWEGKVTAEQIIVITKGIHE
jgi:hypothetical protein